MDIRDYDWATAPDEDLHFAAQASRTELQRRELLAMAPTRADQLAREVLAARGQAEGDEWADPGELGFPRDWVAQRHGKSWRSMTYGNVLEPGTSNNWAELPANNQEA